MYVLKQSGLQELGVLELNRKFTLEEEEEEEVLSFYTECLSWCNPTLVVDPRWYQTHCLTLAPF